MKRIVSTLVVAGVLFGAAVFYAVQAPGGTNPADDPDPPTSSSPQTKAVGSGTLTLKAESSHGFVHADERDRLYTAVDVRAGEYEGLERPPLNLALVIDRSGSMSGQKISHARSAARTIVDRLSARDRVSIISYADRVRTEGASESLDDEAREQLRARIGSLSSGGGTNIGAALKKGRNQLEETGTDRTIDRMLLLSDGRPTEGIRDPGRLADAAESASKTGTSVTTMGVGLDYNEDLMTRMANVGGGNYYFIEKPRQVGSMFETELSKLAETVAENASLIVEFGEGIELESARGYPHERSDGNLVVSLSEFSAGENKSVFLEMTEQLGEGDPQPVVDVELSYQDLRRDQPAHQTARLTAAASPDAAKVENSVASDVVSRAQQVEVADTIDEAMEAFEQGDEQRAREAIEETESQLSEAADQYDLPESKVRKEKQRLSDIESKVKKTAPSTSEGKTVIKRQKEKSNELMLDSTAGTKGGKK